MKLRRDSKTYRANTVILVLSVVSQALPVLAPFFPPAAAVATAVAALLNIGLREVTKDPLVPLRTPKP
jgi:sorbitol-specific phosphotransferase system component IIBC